jgi:hypothetical protein
LTVSADTDLELALDRVVDAARSHLAAVRAAGGSDDDASWAAFVELNNATFAYDELIEDTYGVVTPWDVGAELVVDEAEGEENVTVAEEAEQAAAGPDNVRISVRQRRDYVVPDVDALLGAASVARAVVWREADAERATEPVRSVGEAVYELMQAGDNTLAGLDVPELERHSGLVLVNLVDDVLEPDDLAEPPHQADDMFALPEAPLIFSLYEPMYSSVEEAERAAARQDAEAGGEQ